MPESLDSGEVKIPASTAVQHALNEAAFVLHEVGIGNGRVEALWLAEHILGHRPGYGERFNSQQYQDFFALVGQRAQHVPLQHVMGVMFFRNLKLRARPGVFVVRPETEWVADAGIEAARAWVSRGVSPQVLDLGCGSGALGLSVASEVPNVVLTSVDISPEAVALTRENAGLCGVAAHVLQADATDFVGLTAALGTDLKLTPHEPPKYHVIVTNPPYVVDSVTQPEAAADPPVALYGGGTDGLDIPRKFLNNAAKLLVSGGTLVMEHAETQGEALVEWALQQGFTTAKTETDLAGRPRFLHAITGE